MNSVAEASRKRASMTCYLVAGALLIAGILTGHGHVYSPILNISGFLFLVLGGYVQQERSAPVHTALILIFGVLSSAVLAYTLWSRLGVTALVPALPLLLITSLIVFFARNGRHTAEQL